MAATTQRRVTERENELTTELDDGTDGTHSLSASRNETHCTCTHWECAAGVHWQCGAGEAHPSHTAKLRSAIELSSICMTHNCVANLLVEFRVELAACIMCDHCTCSRGLHSYRAVPHWSVDWCTMACLPPRAGSECATTMACRRVLVVSAPLGCSPCSCRRTAATGNAHLY
jgi:hypothetical protein